jgi:uncharacterized protein YeaO (DUF488 family)
MKSLVGGTKQKTQITIKRIYQESPLGDGKRILVDRLWQGCCE